MASVKLPLTRATTVEFSIQNQHADIDPGATTFLGQSIDGIWQRVQAQPSTYVFTREEFAVFAIFNYYRGVFSDNEIAQQAVQRFWEHYGEKGIEDEEQASRAGMSAECTYIKRKKDERFVVPNYNVDESKEFHGNTSTSTYFKLSQDKFSENLKITLPKESQTEENRSMVSLNSSFERQKEQTSQMGKVDQGQLEFPENFCVDPSQFRMHVSNGKEYSLINSIKLYVEYLTGEVWDWWPLHPSLRQLLEDEIRVLWHCDSEHTHWTVLSKNGSTPLQEALKKIEIVQTAPSKRKQSESISENGSSTITNTSRSSGSESSIRRSSPATSESGSSDQPDDETGSRKDIDPPGTSIMIDIVPPSDLNGFVLFGVHGSKRLQSACLRIAQIDVSVYKDDDSFFNEMTVQYKKLRGFLRLVFSIWVFHTCPQEIPSAKNRDYMYNANRNPPILSTVFNANFYGCKKACIKSRLDLFCFFHECKGRSHCGRYRVLDRLPKRRRKWNIDRDEERDEAWGLNAVFAVSFYKSDRDSPVGTAAPRSDHQAQADVTSLTAPDLNLTHNLHVQHFVQTQPWSGSRISGSRTHGQRHPASQPELPSTIPESLRSKMFGIDSQSEGDTQPVSQSVYKEFASRRTEQLAVREESDNHEDTNLQGADLHSLHEGETGHIDLLGAFEQPSLIDNEHADADHEENDRDPLSQAMDVRADLFPESKRFKQPKTPATDGKKRKRGVGMASQENATTPGLPVNPFPGGIGSMDGMMGPSQLFEATQALTSPLTNIVPSDGLSVRPSPDMHVPQRPSTAGSLSSPADASHFHTVRAVTEPQTTYVSMKESQEARERYLRSLKAAEVLSPDELSDDDFGSADTQLLRRSKQRRIDTEAKKQFAGLTARADPVIRGHGRVRAGRTRYTPSRFSTRQAGRQASEPVLISDDVPIEDTQGNVTEDETEREEEAQAEDDGGLDELAEENKENVEVPRTISRIHHTTSQAVTSQPTPSHQNIRTAKRGSQTSKVVHVENSSQNTRSQEPVKAIEGATQPDAIADSQTSQGRAKPEQNSKANGSRALSGPQSSLDSRVLVPQSQSSQALQAMNLSEENKSSANLQSSPLLLKNGQDITNFNRGLPQASIEPLQTEGPSGELPGSEPASRKTQEPPLSSRPQSNTAQGHHLPMTASVPAQSTIPETSPLSKPVHVQNQPTGGISNSMPSPRTTPKSASKAASSHSVTEQSRPSTLFETAPEHLADSPTKSHPQRLHKASQSRQATPVKTRLSRTISEIAADPTPPGIIGDVDLDINILTNEDVEFQNAISGSSFIAPARKRRRGNWGLALQVAYQEPNKLPPAHLSPLSRSFTSEPPGSSAISPITPHPTSEADRSGLVISKPVIMKQAPTKEDHTSEPKDAPIAKTVTTRATSLSNKAQLSSTPKVATKAQAVVARDVSVPIQQPALHTSASSTDPDPANGRPVIASNRVFAHFNGSNPAYYPATCLEMIGGDDLRYRVRFEDGTVDVIGGYGIKRLELRPGDVVKVDLPGARKLNYVVEGVQDQHVSTIVRDPATPSRRGRSAPTNDSAFPETDVHGNASVLISPKQRLSMDGEQPQSSQIAVPLTLIYLTQTMWTAFKDRQYTHPFNKSQISTGLQTPSERPSTPSTPSSRTRRVKSSGLVQARSTAIGNALGGGIFRNMAFAITNIDRADENDRIKNHITSNGGHILSTGLDELFYIPVLPRTTSPADPNADASFHLAQAAKDVGFTCLIADKHCRTAKFIQALSLGIPCLSTRWITNCVAKQRVLSWEPYLLPSGESAFLGGAVRSRVLQPFDAESAKLCYIVENRPKLLSGASVLIIMEKGQEKSMQQHPLITYALGATKISRAISEASAAKAVADAQALGEPWDWIFSYDKEQEVEEKLFGGSGTGKKRKRGRESEYGPPGKKGKTRVVGNEFVIQSLILGMLIEE
ncbi:MAG: hypothetical protein ASARMPREDX12_004879 [Alectoria sarmentosa]|nr:MAG: hypothetical protein ASARMPREDX12_004879 [Alectoria sarmentosa]